MGIFYPGRHRTCPNCSDNKGAGFFFMEESAGKLKEYTADYNLLAFLLKGSFTMTKNSGGGGRRIYT